MKRMFAALGILVIAGVAVAGEGEKKSVSVKPDSGGRGSVEKKTPLADLTAKVISVDYSAKTLTFLELPKKGKPGEEATGSRPETPTEASKSNQTLPCEGAAADGLGKMKGGEIVRITLGQMKDGHEAIVKIKVLSSTVVPIPYDEPRDPKKKKGSN